MPLISEQGLFEDSWTRLGDDTPIPANAGELSLIVPFARLGEAIEAGVTKLGVQAPNTLRASELAPFFGSLDLISIAFPSFSDGRGFSLARSLRHAGYEGELRAFGPLIADQFAHARACGFDVVEVPEALALRQPADHWAAAAKSLSLAYQRGYERGATILDQRRNDRKVARAA